MSSRSEFEAQKYARRLHSSFRSHVHVALREHDMTRADLAKALGISVERLSRALDKPDMLTVEGMARICYVLGIQLKMYETDQGGRANRMRNRKKRRE